MRIESFDASDLVRLDVQDKQKTACIGSAPDLASGGPAFSVYDGEMLMGCMGIYTLWKGRGLAWALLSRHAGKIISPLTYAARQYFMIAPFHRIEATVDAGFGSAVRWIELLGFRKEGLMQRYSPEGHDHYLYARVAGCRP